MPDDVIVEVRARFEINNDVSPLSFVWTDGETYPVKVLDVQRGAALKKRGSGTRYKIETKYRASYLYRFADLWIMAGSEDPFMPIPDIQTRYKVKNESFHNAIHEGYDNPLKVAVEVEALFSQDGEVRPQTVKWEDGRVFEIDDVKGESERVANLKAGIFGLRYEVKILGKWIYLYRDGDMWYMERKNNISCILDVHGRPM